jgi:predicted nucleotidyltransferase
LGDFDWTVWADTNTRNETRSDARKAERLSKAIQEAQQLAEHFVKADPHLLRVILFGSVARKDPRQEDFDLDLVVEGSQTFGALFAEADRSSFSVDLLEWEGLKPHIQDRVKREGVVLYERK